MFGAFHFGERKVKCQGRFRALVVTHSVFMQTIAASAGAEIVQRHSEIIAAEKPFERAPGFTRP